MTFNQEKLEAAAILCPETKTKLQLAEQLLLDQLNLAIKAGKIQNNAGQVLTQPLTLGLVREDQQILFPVINDIPNMVLDQAIRLDQLLAK